MQPPGLWMQKGPPSLHVLCCRTGAPSQGKLAGTPSAPVLRPSAHLFPGTPLLNLLMTKMLLSSLSPQLDRKIHKVMYFSYYLFSAVIIQLLFVFCCN